jgi:hypothetical protein
MDLASNVLTFLVPGVMVEIMKSHELTMVFLGGMFFGSLISAGLVWAFGPNAGIFFVCLVPFGMLVYDSIKK